MCWCAPSTQRWSLTSTTKEVCVHAPCTGWRTRSLGGPRTNSSRWEQFTFLGISIWEQTSFRGRGRSPGERMLHPEVVKHIWREFGQAQLSTSGESLARHRWRNDSAMSPLVISDSSSSTGWMPWYRRGRGFICMPSPQSLCSWEFWRECAGTRSVYFW